MARKSRRETFWVGFEAESTLSASPDDTATSLVTMAEIEDRTATLVRVVGSFTFRAQRTDTAPQTTSATDVVAMAAGIACVENVADVPHAFDDLSDERWLYTTSYEAHAPSIGFSYWNGSVQVDRYVNHHAAPYPGYREFNIRAMRKFETPCVLVHSFAVKDVSGFADFSQVQLKTLGRALFKAS